MATQPNPHDPARFLTRSALAITLACLIAAARTNAAIIDFETTPAGIAPIDDLPLSFLTPYNFPGLQISFGIDSNSDGIVDTSPRFEHIGSASATRPMVDFRVLWPRYGRSWFRAQLGTGSCAARLARSILACSSFRIRHHGRNRRRWRNLGHRRHRPTWRPPRIHRGIHGAGLDSLNNLLATQSPHLESFPRLSHRSTAGLGPFPSAGSPQAFQKSPSTSPAAKWWASAWHSTTSTRPASFQSRQPGYSPRLDWRSFHRSGRRTHR